MYFSFYSAIGILIGVFILKIYSRIHRRIIAEGASVLVLYHKKKVFDHKLIPSQRQIWPFPMFADNETCENNKVNIDILSKDELYIYDIYKNSAYKYIDLGYLKKEC